MFRIYIEAHLLMVRRQLLSENFYQKNNFEIFVTYFGAFFPCFFYQFLCFPCQGDFGKIPKVTLTWKTEKLVFHVPCFVDEHVTVGLFSEEEGEKFAP